MALLFDISPGDSPQKKRSRARVFVSAPEPIQAESIKGIPQSTRAILPIGRLDDLVECVDSRCQTACHDILTEDRGEWLLQCNFCNCTQWVKVIPGHLEPRDEFVFRDGRFAGLTIDQAAAEQHGMDYLKWAAKSHKRDAVKEAVKKWLDQKSATL